MDGNGAFIRCRLGARLHARRQPHNSKAEIELELELEQGNRNVHEQRL